MGRIRSLKPDFATSERICELSRDTRLHFAMLWTYCDDHGRAIDNPKLIKAAIWPLDDDITAETVETMQRELAGNGRIVRYTVGGRQYFEVCNWTEHQHPNRPAPSKHPAPSEGTDTPCSDDSLKAQCVDSESTLNTHVSSVVESRSRVGESRVDIAPAGDATDLVLVGDAASCKQDDVQLVFDAWIDSTQRTSRTRLDSTRRRRIQNALKQYPLEDVLAAVRGWEKSPHHRGENNSGTVYNDLELLLRDAKHVEMFRDMAHTSAAPNVPKNLRKLAEVAAQIEQPAGRLA